MNVSCISVRRRSGVRQYVQVQNVEYGQYKYCNSLSSCLIMLTRRQSMGYGCKNVKDQVKR